jgi:hypothetical protein
MIKQFSLVQRKWFGVKFASMVLPTWTIFLSPKLSRINLRTLTAFSWQCCRRRGWTGSGRRRTTCRPKQQILCPFLKTIYHRAWPSHTLFHRIRGIIMYEWKSFCKHPPITKAYKIFMQLVPGTDGLILKIFSPKHLAKKLWFLFQRLLFFYHNIGFEKKNFFPPKFTENCDHNIDP